MTLAKGTRMSGEGGGKDRKVAKHGREWRVRTVKQDALATFAPTRDGEGTSSMGGGYSISVMAIGADGRIVRGTDGNPLPLATVVLSIEADALRRKGFSSRDKHLEQMHVAIDAAAIALANLADHDAWEAEMATLPADLLTPAPAQAVQQAMPAPAPAAPPPLPPFFVAKTGGAK